MKVREWSELVAGPRWKTFIRRFRRGPTRHGSGGGVGRKLNYDALNYALNFDEGHPASPSPRGADWLTAARHTHRFFCRSGGFGRRR